MNEPTNLFTVAVLAVHNVPLLLLPPEAQGNPPAPILTSLAIFVPDFTEDPEAMKQAIRNAVGSKLFALLPPGYIISLMDIKPVALELIERAAGYKATNAPLSTYAFGFGNPYFSEQTGEASINTYKPLTDGAGRSPRYSLLCPYCGTPSLRLDGTLDALNPDGMRVNLEMGIGDTEVAIRHDGDAETPAEGQGRVFPDTGHGSRWRGYPGVCIPVTCRRGHRVELTLVEDTAADGSGPTLFLVFNFAEGNRAWNRPKEPGRHTYPERIQKSPNR